MRPYVVRTHPRRDLRNNAELQDEATCHMKSSERVLVRLFVALLTTFGIAAIGGFLGFPWLSVVGIITMAIYVFVGLWYLIPARTVICNRCSERMSVDWQATKGGGSARFLICESCKLFIDTHWSGR